jgi:glycopeptide antibiotics resistance protein
LYEDLGKQPNLVDNPIGTSINHLFCFMYLSALAIICNLKKIQILTSFYFIIFISVFLEASHYIIPNRAFELYDLFANVAGVLMIFLVRKLIK